MRKPIDNFLLGCLIFFLLVPVGVWWWWLLPKQESLKVFRQKVENLRTEVNGLGGKDTRLVPEAQLAEILIHLGTKEQLPERIGRLHNLLQGNGIELLKAAFKMSPSGAGEIARYEIQIELDGLYFDIRSFSRSLLAEDEAISLESIELHRQPGDDGKIRAAMRWVMFVNGITK